jgi:hypothetical protein
MLEFAVFESQLINVGIFPHSNQAQKSWNFLAFNSDTKKLEFLTFKSNLEKFGLYGIQIKT